MFNLFILLTFVIYIYFSTVGVQMDICAKTNTPTNTAMRAPGVVLAYIHGTCFT